MTINYDCERDRIMRLTDYDELVRAVLDFCERTRTMRPPECQWIADMVGRAMDAPEAIPILRMEAERSWYAGAAAVLDALNIIEQNRPAHASSDTERAA